MQHRTIFGILLSLAILMIATVHAEEGGKEAPLRVLLVTGGCCHDYTFQTKQFIEAAKKRGVDVDWTVVNEGGKKTFAQIDLYKDANWATGYDVIVHNECFAKTSDPEYIRSITQAHQAGANSVVIHCAMHTYREAKIDDWREFLGVTSRHHEHKSNYPVVVTDKEHWITQAIPEGYKTPMDELYIIEKVWPKTKVLATSVSEKTNKTQPVFWTNEYGKARVFGTTYGHSNETFSDEVFLEVIVRGLQWAAKREPKS